jgi:glycosyltransferase A (GT-A) superfamily protein (DUF2064 family)
LTGLTVVVAERACHGERAGAVLRERTLAIARAVAGERVVLTGDPAAALAELEGPVIVVATDVPRLTRVHFEIAVLDLSEGVDVSFGPTFDEGYYLIAMREPRPDLLSLPAGGGGALGRALAAAGAAGLEVGLLRMERRLGDAADAVALLADPLLDASVRAALTE